MGVTELGAVLCPPFSFLPSPRVLSATLSVLITRLGRHWVGQKVCFCLCDGSSSAYLSLTSFKIFLLDCIVTAVISVCIKKNLSKLVNFCVDILILKMKESM